MFNCSFPFVNNRNESVIVSLLGISRNDRLFGKSNWNVWSHSKIYEDEFSNITVGWIIILSHREHRTHFGCTFFFLSRSLSLITRAHTQKNVRRLAAILSSLFSLVFIQNWKSVNCVCVCMFVSLRFASIKLPFFFLFAHWTNVIGRFWSAKMQKCLVSFPVRECFIQIDSMLDGIKTVSACVEQIPMFVSDRIFIAIFYCDLALYMFLSDIEQTFSESSSIYCVKCVSQYMYNNKVACKVNA